MNQSKGRGLARLAALVAILGAAFLAVRFSPLGDYLSREGALAALDGVRGSMWGPLLFVAAYAVATALALPGTVLTLTGGAVFGFAGGTLLNWIGANIGANLAFGLARWLGRDGLRSLLGERADGLDRVSAEHGFRTLFTLRLIPVVPFNALNFAGGLTAIRWPSYLAATAIGILPGTAVYTYFADALLQGSREASREALLRVLAAGALLVLLSLLPALVKRLKIRLPDATTGLLLLGTAATMLSAQTPTLSAQSPLPTHGDFTALLSQVVDAPRVDYAGLQQRRDRLDTYLATLAVTRPEALEAASREARLAFWINAYNACMLKRVVDHYPISRPRSILQRIKNRFADRPANSVWQIPDVFTGAHCEVAGSLRSQDEIEHSIIRPMGDPRIHFVVNCAARSCPPLQPRAFEAATVDAQLDEAVRGFVAAPAHFATDGGAEPVLRLNKVLDWYGSDFDAGGGLAEFFLDYVGGDLNATLSAPDLRIEFFEYDWSLNDTAG